MEEQLELRRDRLIFWSPSLVQLLTALSGLFVSIRALLDLLPRLVGQTLGVGRVPASLNDKRLRRSDLPENVKNLFTSYWKTKGQRVAEYRDLDLHHWSVAEHCFLRLTNPPSVLVVLPDNPGLKSRAAQTFSKQIDGIQFAQQSVLDLDALITRLCAVLGGKPAPVPISVSLDHFGKLEEGVSQTIAVLFEDPAKGRGIIVGQNEERNVTAREFDVGPA